MSSTCKLAISTSTTLNQTKPLRFFTSSRTLYSLENILPSKLWPNIILDLLQWQKIATLLLPLLPSSEHFRLGAIDITRNRSRVIFCRACVEIFRRWTKATVFPTCNSWLNFRVRGQFAIKTWIVRHINTTYFIRIKKNWTCACDHLKTSNLSADNVKNTWPRWVDTWARDTVKRHWSAGTLFWQLSIYQNINVQYVCIISFPLPGPYAASFQALSVNAFRWRIRYERPGDA